MAKICLSLLTVLGVERVPVGHHVGLADVELAVGLAGPR